MLSSEAGRDGGPLPRCVCVTDTADVSISPQCFPSKTTLQMSPWGVSQPSPSETLAPPNVSNRTEVDVNVQIQTRDDNNKHDRSEVVNCTGFSTISRSAYTRW